MSNDLISRSAATEEFYKRVGGDLMVDEVEYIEKVINEVPTAYDVDKQWIPCSERLPEESLESVIGWDEYRERCCFVQYYNGQWILGNSNASVKIVAWMPLPNPYKKD